MTLAEAGNHKKLPAGLVCDFGPLSRASAWSVVINLAPRACSSVTVRCSIFRLQSFDCILDHRDAAAAFKQSLGRQANAVFRYHPEDNEFRLISQSFYEFRGVPALEDVERLFFEMNLLVLKKDRGGSVAVASFGTVTTFSVSASGTTAEPAVPLMQWGGNVLNSGSSLVW